MKSEQHSLLQALRSSGDGRLHDPGERIPHDERGELVGGGRRRERALEDPLLRVHQREVKAQRLIGEVEARAELARAIASLAVRRDLVSEERHEIFSMFTRNALNSGVRAFASPTNGVSAFASQFFESSGLRSAEMPTKPQWIGIPM